MVNHNDTMPELIQRILDGDATPEEIQRAEQDADLRAALDSMRTIESHIKRAFPPADAPSEIPAPAAAGIAGRIGLTPRYLGYAAIIAILAGVWWNTARTTPPTIETGQLFADISSHMSPEYVCSDAQAFEEYTHKAFGTTITAAFSSPVELIGWRGLFGSYEFPEFPGRTLLARSPEGEPVLAFFVTRAVHTPKIPDGSGLHVYTKRFGGVEVHEVSTLDHAVVLPLLSRVRD